MPSATALVKSEPSGEPPIAAPPGRRQPIVGIDLVRGMAALMVFVYHYNIHGMLIELTGIEAFRWVGIPGAKFAVPLFFALSGFCIHWSEWNHLQAREPRTIDLRTYARRRFWRIYPPYLFALLLSCVIVSLAGGTFGGRDFLVHFALLQGLSDASFNTINVVLWSVSIEACLYFVYPVWLWLRLRWGVSRATLAGMAVSLLSCALTAPWAEQSIAARWFFLNLWAGWLAGAWLAETMFDRPAMFRRPGWWLAGVVAWLGGVAWWRYASAWPPSASFDGNVLTLLALWPLSAFVVAEPCWRSMGQGWSSGLVRLGQACGLCSYSLYLLHVPLIQARMLLVAGIDSRLVQQAAIVLGFPAIVGICWVSYRCLELPFMKYRPK